MGKRKKKGIKRPGKFHRPVLHLSRQRGERAPVSSVFLLYALDGFAHKISFAPKVLYLLLKSSDF